jgi:hypothetical protein
MSAHASLYYAESQGDSAISPEGLHISTWEPECHNYWTQGGRYHLGAEEAQLM